MLIMVNEIVQGDAQVKVVYVEVRDRNGDRNVAKYRCPALNGVGHF